MKSVNNEKNRRTLGNLLRDIRNRAGLKQDELAEQMGQTQSFISKWEAGQRRIDVLQLSDFCEIVGTTLPKFVRQLEKRLEKFGG